RLADRLDRSLRGARHLDGERRLELALGQEPHLVPQPAQQPRRDQRRAIDGYIGTQPPGFNGLLQPPEIDLVEFLAEGRIGEAALRQAAMQRRLAALEAVEGDARPRRLALAAAAAGLALARADAAADALEFVMRPGIVPDLVEFHRLPS